MQSHRTEWPTVALFVFFWALFIALTLNYPQLPWWIVLPCGTCLLTLYGSMQHEVIHGHPTKWRRINELSVFPGLWIWLPYAIYRYSHLKHHKNSLVTDPFDDPESYYVAQAQWDKTGMLMRAMYMFRNTLFGRLLLGPAWAILEFTKQEIVYCISGNSHDHKISARENRNIWYRHLVSVALPLLWLSYCQIPYVEYFLFFVYPALSLTLLRSYLEHQAERQPQHRTVIVNSGWILGLLFLNNNLHALHHEQPALPWYTLPGVWKNSRAEILGRNGGYFYNSYFTLFRRYLLTVKTHPRHPHR